MDSPRVRHCPRCDLRVVGQLETDRNVWFFRCPRCKHTWWAFKEEEEIEDENNEEEESDA